MNELLQILSSPIWWFSVVVVGILINLISAYLKSPIDENLSKISIWWRRRIEQQKAEQDAFINTLSNDQHEQIIASIDDLRHRLRSVQFLILGVFMILVLNWSEFLFQDNFIVSIVRIGGMAFASVSVLFSVRSFFRAMAIKRNINLARKSKNKKVRNRA